MIVKTVDEFRLTDRKIDGPGWESIRMLLAKDQFGFSFHFSTMAPGQTLNLWYKNHLEACFCIKGSGTIRCLDSGVEKAIKPGTLYALDKHDRHQIEVHEEMVALCVFNPALSGNEVHDKDGSYELTTEQP
ncbi:hypothetical protein Q672_20120 [Marinobacter sp. EVN1]|uniref:ectoine synthase n=1 Tax=Marinobacter sp. EVN1 TaxID=1397532 RepID=UPI0003B8ACC4|nr:ectoine synthase [Marinobacter sp. EVN1]ERS83389.1 hypothetical protein Q672_20120 [Marinobacter sp. EVN1]